MKKLKNSIYGENCTKSSTFDEFYKLQIFEFWKPMKPKASEIEQIKKYFCMKTLWGSRIYLWKICIKFGWRTTFLAIRNKGKENKFASIIFSKRMFLQECFLEVEMTHTCFCGIIFSWKWTKNEIFRVIHLLVDFSQNRFRTIYLHGFCWKNIQKPGFHI